MLTYRAMSRYSLLSVPLTAWRFLHYKNVGTFTYISTCILIFLEYNWIKRSDLEDLLLCSFNLLTPSGFFPHRQV